MDSHGVGHSESGTQILFHQFHFADIFEQLSINLTLNSSSVFLGLLFLGFIDLLFMEEASFTFSDSLDHFLLEIFVIQFRNIYSCQFYFGCSRLYERLADSSKRNSIELEWTSDQQQSTVHLFEYDDSLSSEPS